MSHFWEGCRAGFSFPSLLVAEGGTGKGRLDWRATLPNLRGRRARRGSRRLPGPQEGPHPPGPRPQALRGARGRNNSARGRAGRRGRGAPPGTAPGPPPALAHPFAHWLPPAARPGTARGSRRRRRARHGRPPVPLGARGGRAARGRAGRPGAPGLLPLRQGRRGRGGGPGGRGLPAPSDPEPSHSVPGWSAGSRHPAARDAGALGDTRGEMPAVPTRGDMHPSAPPTGACHSRRSSDGDTHAQSCWDHRQKSPRQSHDVTVTHTHPRLPDSLSFIHRPTHSDPPSHTLLAMHLLTLPSHTCHPDSHLYTTTRSHSPTCTVTLPQTSHPFPHFGSAHPVPCPLPPSHVVTTGDRHTKKSLRQSLARTPSDSLSRTLSHSHAMNGEPQTR